MRLSKVEIEGYRSIRDALTLVIDRHVTVVLGPNDHGKTNLVEALLHLNEDASFDLDRDLNWDCAGRRDDLPSIAFEFILEEDERDELRVAEVNARNIDVAESTYRQAADEVAELEKESVRLQAASARAEGDREKAQAAFEAAKSLQDDEPGAAATESLTRAMTGLPEAVGTATKLLGQADSVSGALDLARQRLALLAGYEVLVRSRAAGESDEGAVDKAARAAEAARKAAEDEVGKAKERLSAAQAAKTTAEAVDDNSNEKSLAAEVSAATRSLRQAERNLRQQTDQVAVLRDAAAAFQERSAQEIAELVQMVPAIEDLPDAEVPSTVVIRRQGVRGEREVVENSAVRGTIIGSFVQGRLPRVELIRPVQQIPDSSSFESLKNEDYAFMRGVFHYAGLQQDEWPTVFKQDDVMTKRLRDASAQLNETLRDSWSQGRQLTFRLDHDSARKRVNLLISDPAVSARDVRASRRSSGFTHFFALKTILHARQIESPASSYLWVFDEPGIFLHPDGQHDLIQVLETLAQTNQVIYTTHSVFLVNKNYPARHRLLVKTAAGTKLDAKPHSGNWKAALNALGLSFPGTILFASRVLLVEGDSDPMLLYAMLQKLIELGRLTVDLNDLAIMGTGDSKHADALIRILTEASAKPRIAALFDGDSGGKARCKALEPLLAERKIPHRVLTPADTTVEDHLPAAGRLYIEATAKYVAKIVGESDALDTFRTEGHTTFGEKVPKGLASWSREEGRKLAGLDEKLSSVGIAREYVDLLLAADEEVLPDNSLARADQLALWIVENLSLEGQILEQEAIVEENGP